VCAAARERLFSVSRHASSKVRDRLRAGPGPGEPARCWRLEALSEAQRSPAPPLVSHHRFGRISRDYDTRGNISDIELN